MNHTEATIKTLEALGDEIDVVSDAVCKAATHLENIDKHQEAQAIALDDMSKAMREMQNLLGQFVDEVRRSYGHVEGRVSSLEKQVVTAEDLMRAQARH